MKFNEDLSVSVVVPFYNRSRFLKRLLDSVAAQTLAADKVYIIDNGSSLEETLKAWEIITTHKLVDKCVFTSSIGKGNANFARNLGYELAKTKYVAFLDSDDWWDKHHLHYSIYCLKKSNKVGVYSGAKIHMKHHQIATRSADINQLDSPFSLIMSTKGYIAQTSSYIVNKKKLGFQVTWDNNLKRHQDYDYFASIYYNTNGWCYSAFSNTNIDWDEGGTNKRNIDFNSLIYYYTKWNHLFPEDVRENYLKRTLYLAYLANTDSKTKNFYHAELFKYGYIRNFQDKIIFSKGYLYSKITTLNILEKLNIKNILKKSIYKLRSNQDIY